MKKILVILLGPIVILSMSPKTTINEFVSGSNYSKVKKITSEIFEQKRINSVPTSTAFTVPSFEDIIIYRIQLRISTCNSDDAGTDDGVYVQMNKSDEKFYLNKSTDDFRQGRNETYDVLSETIKKVKDITFLKIGIRGDDGVCISKIELFLNNNNSPVFSKSFPGHGKSVDNSQSFTITESELRNYSGWALTPKHQTLSGPPHAISKSMILSLIECSIGNHLNHLTQEPKFSWGSKVRGLPNTLFGPGTEVKFVNNKTLHFDLDLQAKVGGPNPEVDVDFDLVFNCNNGIIKTEIKNITYGSNWIGDLQKLIREKGSILIGSAIGTEVGHPAAGAASGAALAKYLSFNINMDLPNQNVSSSCMSINVSPACDIMLR